MKIGPMAAKHIPMLMHHEQAMFGPESWSAAAYREELADRHNRSYIVALDGGDGGGELLGWAGLRVLADEAEVLTIGVVPEARRRGVGAALLAELLDEARRRAARVAFLDVRVDNDDAQRIYVRAGFTAVGVRRGYYDNGRTDSLTMSLTLEKVS